MEIFVRDKVFKIGFVNNYCRNRYDDMVNAVIDLTSLSDKYTGLTEEDIDREELKKRVADLESERRRLKKEVCEIRQDIIKELLETNSYEYDEKWWDRKCDADDLNNFTLAAINKDETKAEKSKKK